MIIRMVTLLMLIAQVKLNSVDASGEDEEQRKREGQGFASILIAVTILGAVLLAVLIVLAVLSFMGEFDQRFLDAEV